MTGVLLCENACHVYPRDAAINTWNRLRIATGAEHGHYQPGDFVKATVAAGAEGEAA